MPADVIRAGTLLPSKPVSECRNLARGIPIPECSRNLICDLLKILSICELEGIVFFAPQAEGPNHFPARNQRHVADRLNAGVSNLLSQRASELAQLFCVPERDHARLNRLSCHGFFGPHPAMAILN